MTTTTLLTLLYKLNPDMLLAKQTKRYFVAALLDKEESMSDDEDTSVWRMMIRDDGRVSLAPLDELGRIVAGHEWVEIEWRERLDDHAEQTARRFVAEFDSSYLANEYDKRKNVWLRDAWKSALLETEHWMGCRFTSDTLDETNDYFDTAFYALTARLSPHPGRVRAPDDSAAK